jgi:hypothetical protein
LCPCDLSARHVIVALAQFAQPPAAVREALRRPEQIVISRSRLERA